MKLSPKLPVGPDGWQMALGAFAFCKGLKLLIVTNLFQTSPEFSTLAKMPITQRWWSIILLLYAASSLMCLVFGANYKRASIGIIGTGMWFFLGTEMLWGAVAAHLWVSDGLFELLAGFGCAVSVAQWARLR